MHSSTHTLTNSINGIEQSLDKLRKLVVNSVKLPRQISENLESEVFAIMTKYSPITEQVEKIASNPEYLLEGQKFAKGKAPTPSFSDQKPFCFDSLKAEGSSKDRVQGSIYYEPERILFPRLPTGIFSQECEAVGQDQFVLAQEKLVLLPEKKSCYDVNEAGCFITCLERKAKEAWNVDSLSLSKESMDESHQPLTLTIKEAHGEVQSASLTQSFNDNSNPQLVVQTENAVLFFKSTDPKKGTYHDGDDGHFATKPLKGGVPHFAVHKDLIFVFGRVIGSEDDSPLFNIVVYKTKAGSRPTLVAQESGEQFRGYKSFILREKEYSDKKKRIFLFVHLDDTTVIHSVYDTNGKRIGTEHKINVSENNTKKYKIKGISYNVEKASLFLLVCSSKAKAEVKVIRYVVEEEGSNEKSQTENLKITMAGDLADQPIFFSADLATDKEIILFLCTDIRSFTFLFRGEHTSKTKREFKLFGGESELTLRNLAFNPSDKSLVLMIETRESEAEEEMSMQNKSSVARAPLRSYRFSLKVDLTLSTSQAN
jgi:hypothetical protein